METCCPACEHYGIDEPHAPTCQTRAWERADAALDAAEFNDPREQDRLQHEADLRFEYSGPEYDEYGPDRDDDDE